MAALIKLIKTKPKAHINPTEHQNPYAVALQFPEEEDILFDGDLKLLLMDGLDHVPLISFLIDLISDGHVQELTDT
jgi:hypothetical protein